MLLLTKGIILLLLGIILFNLFSGLFSMLRQNNDKPMSHYLGRRVLYSVVVLVLLLLLMATGILPHNPRPY
ncbi:DUF2909 family protein [Corallincola luteus]|uniref:DUF2909 family protein n=1 Tax=Corallincola luteus TaxID=1775177 RepID=UPI00196B24B2|nr:DUF2909 family protein [Corallincola luteus]